MTQKSPHTHRMPAAQRWSRKAVAHPSRAMFIEYLYVLEKMDRAMANTSISKAVAIVAAPATDHGVERRPRCRCHAVFGRGGSQADSCCSHGHGHVDHCDRSDQEICPRQPHAIDEGAN